jgi:predicted RNA-binding Zn-ribbon protein involved in translation (DUF1610 family)
MTLGTNIVVRCPDCGDSLLSPAEVTVRECLDTGEFAYRFTCPMCGLRTLAESETTALIAAVGAGAEFEVWTVPVETVSRPEALPFSPYDAIELGVLLEQPDWFDALLRCELDSERED